MQSPQLEQSQSVVMGTLTWAHCVEEPLSVLGCPSCQKSTIGIVKLVRLSRQPFEGVFVQ
jgi:hypothetical protein